MGVCFEALLRVGFGLGFGQTFAMDFGLDCCCGGNYHWLVLYPGAFVFATF